MAHLLTQKNLETLTADCSVCGTGVEITRNGKGRVSCAEARRLAQQRFRQAHPERVRQWKKRPPSKHRLAKRDGSADTCAVCGPVTPVAVGRGYGCPNRAKERGHTKFPEAPQPACPICRTYLDRYGACAKCDDDLSDLDAAYMPGEARRQVPDIAAQYVAAGYSISSWELPLAGDEEPPAVPGWKTIGSRGSAWNESTSVRPDYASLYRSGNHR